jgi:lipopolysaccharide export system protein LptC
MTEPQKDLYFQMPHFHIYREKHHIWENKSKNGHFNKNK